MFHFKSKLTKLQTEIVTKMLPNMLTKMDQDGPRWTKMDQDGPRWTQMDQDGPRLTMQDYCKITARLSKNC